MIRKRPISTKDYKGNECILVARAVVSSIQTLLGPSNSLKCCQSSGISITTSSTPKVLESMDIEHPAGYIINNACQSFRKQFGCGCTTLVCLIGYWGRAVQVLSEMGIPIPVIAQIMDETYNEFEKVFAKSFISLEFLGDWNQNKAVLSRDLSSFESLTLLVQRPANGGFLGQFKTATDNGERNTNLTDFSRLTKLSDDCDEFSWYFDHVENFKSMEKDPFSLPDINVSHKAFQTQLCSGKEQSLQSLPGAEGDLDPVNGQVKQTNHQLTHPKTILNEHSLEILGKDMSFSEDCIKPPAHEESILDDEFDSCFDEVSVKGGTSGMAEVPTTKMTHPLKSRVEEKSLTRLTGSENLVIQELLNNKLLASRRSMTRISNKTNIEKIFRKSRHLADMSVTNLEIPSESIDLGIKSLSIDGSSTHSRGHRCEDYLEVGASVIGRRHKDKEKLPNYKNKKIISGKSYLDIRDFELLGRSLAHGKESEMKFALEILNKQYIASDCTMKQFSFSSDFIALQTVIGPPSCNSRVLDGIVIMLSERNKSIVTQDCCKRPSHIMLVNGDIAFNYRHAGYKGPVEVTRVFEKKDFNDISLSERNKWIQKAMLVVQNLNVGVVGARGNVDNDLRDYWQGSGVVILEGLNHCQLELLSKMTKTSIISYPLDFRASDVGDPVVTTVWYSGWSSGKWVENSPKAPGVETIALAQVNVYDDDESTSKVEQMVHTLLLCGPVADLVHDSELKFWNCVNRLRNALADQQVLPGAGVIERRCIEHLEAIKGSGMGNKTTLSNSLCHWTLDDSAAFRPLIYDALIKGLKDFISRVDINAASGVSNLVSENPTGFSGASAHSFVCDNYVCKVEGWKRALRIVKLLLCSEYHIVTGV